MENVMNVEEAMIASQEARDNVFSQFDVISVGDYTTTLRELTKSEADYQIASIWFQELFSKQAEEHTNEKNALRSSYERQIESHADDVEELNTLRLRVSELTDKLSAEQTKSFELTEKLSDEQAKQDAAAARALEAEEEVNRLQDEIKTLRSQLEKPKETIVTNTSANLAELMKQRELSKPAITNVRWKDDLKKNAYLATLVLTNEEIEISLFDKGMYREVTTEEAERFRAEQQEQAETIEETVEVPTLDLTPPRLQVPEENSAVPGDAVIPKMVLTAEEVTEKLNDLEQRIKALEVA